MLPRLPIVAACFAALCACGSDPLPDELPITMIEAHMQGELMDFEFTLDVPKGQPCPKVGALIDARLNGLQPVITRKGGKDKVLEQTTGKVGCFSPLIAFNYLGPIAGDDLTLTMVTKNEPWVIKMGNAPLTPRTLTPVKPFDGSDLGGTTIAFKMSPAAPVTPKAAVEIATHGDMLIAMAGIDEPTFRVTGDLIEVDVPENAGRVGLIRFKHLWVPTITGCPDGVACVIETDNIVYTLPLNPPVKLAE